MKAAVHERFGPPEEVVQIREVEKPVPGDDEVLVRVRAASINIADWYGVVGRPWVGRISSGLRRPKEHRLGVDYAGTVEAVGRNVTDFAPGDDVFGGRTGAYAEYVTARADRTIAKKPADVNFEEAAAVPIAGITALQGFTQSGEQYDLLIDIAGTRSWSACKRVLRPDATVVVVGGSRANRLLGPLGHVVGMRLGGLRSRQKVVFFIAKLNKTDLETLRGMLESGQVKPVVTRTFPLTEIGAAFRYFGEAHPPGKVVVTV